MSRWTRALVTGASSGIGRELTRLLADDGIDLVLVARSADRLETDAADLRQIHGVDVEVLPADLTDADDLARVEARLAATATPVDLLVNNAGFGTFGRFAELDVDGEEAEVRLNVVAVVRLSHAAARTMRSRRHGGILTVSSLAAFQPDPYMATYGATKAFVSSFGEALHEELRGDGIHVTVVCPGFTRTDFQRNADVEDRASAVPGPLWMEPEDVARAALAGIDANRAVVVPGRVYQAVSMASRSVPSVLGRKAVAMAMRWRA